MARRGGVPGGHDRELLVDQADAVLQDAAFVGAKPLRHLPVVEIEVGFPDQLCRIPMPRTAAVARLASMNRLVAVLHVYQVRQAVDEGEEKRSLPKQVLVELLALGDQLAENADPSDLTAGASPWTDLPPGPSRLSHPAEGKGSFSQLSTPPARHLR